MCLCLKSMGRFFPRMPLIYALIFADVLFCAICAVFHPRCLREYFCFPRMPLIYALISADVLSLRYLRCISSALSALYFICVICGKVLFSLLPLIYALIFADVFYLRHLRCLLSALSAGKIFVPGDAADCC